MGIDNCTWRLEQLLGVDMLLSLLQQPVVRLAGLRVGADVGVVGPVVGLGVRTKLELIGAS